MFASHAEHVQAHLERVRYGHFVDASPEDSFLGREEDDHFWELVGLRLAGCPMVVLALLRFRRIELENIEFGRESLATYLSDLPAPGWTDETGALTALLPPHEHGIPFYLKRLRSGHQPRSVRLDPHRIEAAFDFRLQNPILIPDLRDQAGPLQDHCYRTAGGHVIRGRSHEVPVVPPEEPHRFFAISSPEQVTPSGVYPLPTLFVNRSFLAFRAQARTREEMAAVTKWVPFVASAASAESVLPLPVQPGQTRVFG